MIEHNCRICGLYIEEPTWGKNGSCPTYEICPCCGVEFGNDDYTIKSTKEYRAKWLSEGATWFYKKEKPDNWDIEKQIENIPKAFR